VLSPPSTGQLREKMTNRTIHMTPRGFPSPFEVEIPPECEGWEAMYAYHNLFSEERREFDDSRCWFQLASHYAEPFCPFDATFLDYLDTALNQMNSRVFAVPPSLGFEHRILSGYAYHSPNSVTDEATLARRAELFAERGRFYYEHWDELLIKWEARVEEAIRALAALEVPTLPDLEDEAIVTEGRGVGSSHALLVAYDRLLEGFDRICHYHVEFSNLAYGAYLVFYALCRQAFPDISDQTVAKMVSGFDTLILRPDDELRRLARLAVALGLGQAVKSASDEEELHRVLAASDGGKRWLADWEHSKDPWFCFSYGNGLYHHHRSWIDDPALPLATIGSYIERLEAGEDISRPQDKIAAERERITGEYRELLPDELREEFDEQLALCRQVFPHVESHGFYIDHWYHTLFWNKVREFGALLTRHRFLAESEDVFFLQRGEIRSALEELRLHWSSGGSGHARGPCYWPPIVERRKGIYEAMREWTPPPALGPVPEAITEPLTIMLLGITMERVHNWLGSDGTDERVLRGFAASPGVAEGTARVVLSPDRLGELEDGEILVAPFTTPSWAPVFGKIAAAVTDAGGIMSHAAIVAREYGLPTVVGTGTATKRIRTGDRLRVDGASGWVTILQGAQDRVR
jgi:pyruvate,water dikinase